MKETAKILGLPDLKVTSTCVRVPVTVGHCLAVTAQFSRPVKVKNARAVLRDAAGLRLHTDDRFAMPTDCRGDDSVHVSRVRPGAAPDEISLWIAADNLRKGAALNAVQIAELLLKEES